MPLALKRLLEFAQDHPQRVLGIGLAIAVVGWGVGTQIETQSDIRELAPQSIREVRDLNELQEATGVSGQLDVRVEAPDLTDPATLRWMAEFKHRVLEENGFSGPNPSCLDAEVCPGPSLADFVVGGGGPLRRADVRRTLAEIPAYDLRQVATVDPQSGLPDGVALLSFGIRAQSLQDQQDLIDRVRGEIGAPGEPGGPPAGVDVELAGLPVIAAAAASDLEDSRYWLTLAGLLAVALVLLAVYRSPRRALVPLVPVLLASGWSALVLWLSGVPLNPMSAALGALTIAIATEFSVILAARFHEERDSGRSVAEALEASYSRTGAAVLASGAHRRRRLRGADRQRREHAAGLRLGHRDRPRRRPDRGDGGAAGGSGDGAGAELRDRYSIVVGLLFVAVVAIALISGTGRDGGGTLGLDQQARHWPLPEFAAAARRRRARRRRQHRPGRLRDLRAALSGGRAADAGLRAAHPRRRPRLRPLRPPGADLFLVHQRRRGLRRAAGRGQQRLRALPWARGLSLGQRARRSRHGSRAGRRAALADAGRL